MSTSYSSARANHSPNAPNTPNSATDKREPLNTIAVVCGVVGGVLVVVLLMVYALVRNRGKRSPLKFVPEATLEQTSSVTQLSPLFMRPVSSSLSSSRMEETRSLPSHGSKTMPLQAVSITGSAFAAEQPSSDSTFISSESGWGGGTESVSQNGRPRSGSAPGAAEIIASFENPNNWDRSLMVDMRRASVDFASIPQLIQRLNEIMAQLPPGGRDDLNEAPPRYEG
jgi:hypothetical protein